MRPSGGYRKTASFQTATIIYDGTYWFCEKFLDPRSRTVDQMVLGGRSGRQNVAEASRAGNWAGLSKTAWRYPIAIVLRCVLIPSVGSSSCETCRCAALLG